MFEEGNENGILSRIIQNQLQDIQNKDTPKNIEEDEEQAPPKKFDDSSDDSSTGSNIDGQRYTKPLDSTLQHHQLKKYYNKKVRRNC